MRCGTVYQQQPTCNSWAQRPQGSKGHEVRTRLGGGRGVWASGRVRWTRRVRWTGPGGTQVPRYSTLPEPPRWAVGWMTVTERGVPASCPRPSQKSRCTPYRARSRGGADGGPPLGRGGTDRPCQLTWRMALGRTGQYSSADSLASAAWKSIAQMLRANPRRVTALRFASPSVRCLGGPESASSPAAPALPSGGPALAPATVRRHVMAGC